MPRFTIPVRALALIAALAISSSVAVSPAMASSLDGPPAWTQTDGDSARSSGQDSPSNLAPAAAGVVTGRLIVTTLAGSSQYSVDDGGVSFYSSNFPFEFIRTFDTDINGNFTASVLGAGTYTVAFFSRQEPAQPVREWYNQDQFQQEADVVTLTNDTPFDFGTIVLGERSTDVTRIAGADRFATAVALSQERWADGSAPPVYIVNGLDFPDALSAGALAAREGVLLPVTPTSIPTVVQAELTRLDPSSILIVGGTGVVSNAVRTQLESYVDNASLVDRVGGADRYDTSRQIAAGAFDPANPEIFIATGATFPDALSAVPAAGVTGGVVLLVNGSAASLDSATESLIAGLGPDSIHVIGGTGVVSPGIFDDLTALAGDVERFFGTDRFETAVNVAVEFFPAADYAFLANGLGFADALTAGPLAAQYDSPIYLARQNCVPSIVVDDVRDVLANLIVGVGGTGVLSNEALFTGNPC